MIVYRKSVQLVQGVYEDVEPYLRPKDRELADQLHRAVRSVVLNVAEGRSQRGKRKNNHFAIALGSGREVHACLELAGVLGFVKQHRLRRWLSLSDEVQAMLFVLSR